VRKIQNPQKRSLFEVSFDGKPLFLVVGFQTALSSSMTCKAAGNHGGVQSRQWTAVMALRPTGFASPAF
jgi:hypothetical protein